MTSLDAELEARTLSLVASYCRQRLSATGVPKINEPGRLLTVHATAKWSAVSDWNWFADPSQRDILFEIDISSEAEDTRSEQVKDSDWEGTIGGLRYNDRCFDLEGQIEQHASVSGNLSLTPSAFDDLWDRAKHHVALPCRLSLEVLGLTLDLSGPGRDLWDVRKQPKLKVLGAVFYFEVGEPVSPRGSGS